MASLSGTAQEILADPLRFAWSGGMNNCQYCAIDLNLDGIKDLLIFDRHGNRRLTFVYDGPPGTLQYTFKPELAEQLPSMTDWVITADYNHDGRMDIFTYHNGGARVYRNDSEGSLQFTLVTNLLESWYYNGYVGILITSVDYPAIADVDGDGDLDLLTFFGLGSWVEYHRNLSVERYGHPDTLDFRMEDPCWGLFRESESSNRIMLNAECWRKESPDPIPVPEGKERADPPKHTGSTLTLFDLNGDGLQDLILGDIDYPNLIALFNGGSAEKAFMTSMDTLFPTGSSPVALYSFPLASRIDLDQDGADDLVVSSFDPSLRTADNYNGNWYYRNTGTNANPVFILQDKRCFQKEMLEFGSGANPLLHDMDADGLSDLIVTSAGYYDSSWYHQGILKTSYRSRISYFRNEGTPSQPLFRLLTTDLAGASQLNLDGFFVTAGDLNGDGLQDLLTGCADGSLVFFPSTGIADHIPRFGEPVPGYMGIDPGEYSTPQIFDLDRDGLLDLVIGERKGNINYYRNTGSVVSPMFELVTDSLGRINVTDPMQSYDGYSTPFFFRTAGGTRLLCGSEQGRIWYFTGIDGNTAGRFFPSDSLRWLIGQDPDSQYRGWRSSPAAGNLTDPVLIDLITGNYAGGLQYLSNRISPGIHSPMPAEAAFTAYPNPADEWVQVTRRNTGTTLTPKTAGRSVPVILIMDISGRKLRTVPFREDIRIDTRTIPDGYYLLKAETTTIPLLILHR